MHKIEDHQTIMHHHFFFLAHVTGIGSSYRGIAYFFFKCTN